MRAAVFAYHNVGVRCLKVLLAQGVEVALVVSHPDAPGEAIWFESVAELARAHGLPLILAERSDDPAVRAALADAHCDCLFSFYCRFMLAPELLALAPGGAYNMHGSLLPKFRGRVPVNWAILEGESETGATLHEMVAKPDAGAILGQTAVPILPDDTALEVFNKVTVAAEVTLWRVLPDLVAGRAKRHPNDLARGSYYGGRKPEDGRIDWRQDARRVYNLVRAVAPPYPGAFTELAGRRFVVAAARFDPTLAPEPHLEPGLAVRDNRILGQCGDGRHLVVTRLLEDGAPIPAAALIPLLSS